MTLADGPIRVITSCDEGYLPYLGVLATSLAASRDQSTAVELTVLQPGISAGARQKLAESTAGITVNWIDVDSAIHRELGIEEGSLFTLPHYFRCLIGTLLPAQVRRCVYLDGDTLVRGDLRELWSTDLGGAVVGAALDHFLPRTGDAIAPWRELGIDPEARYFNSGVLLVDLDAWRAEDVGMRALRTCMRHRDHLYAKGKWAQHDQFGLNAVLQNRWRQLSQDWNYLSEMPPHEPHVVHYCGGGKPASPTCQAVFASWFHETLAHTAWRDWRP